MSSLGSRLFQARLDLSARRGRTVSQAQIAEALGVTQQAVGNWEGDRSEPTLSTIQRLAEVLETSPEYLAFGTRKGGRPARPGRGSGEKEA